MAAAGTGGTSPLDSDGTLALPSGTAAIWNSDIPNGNSV